jgi:hypothetical protein
MHDPSLLVTFGQLEYEVLVVEKGDVFAVVADVAGVSGALFTFYSSKLHVPINITIKSSKWLL